MKSKSKKASSTVDNAGINEFINIVDLPGANSTTVATTAKKASKKKSNKSTSDNADGVRVDVTPVINSKLMQQHNLKHIVTIDFGNNEIYYYDVTKNADASIPITSDEFLLLPSKYSNTLFVGESAHLDRPRTMKSFAQPFKAEELNLFKKMCSDHGNMLRLFPEMLSKEVVGVSGLEKSDSNDPISLYKYLMRHHNFVDVLKVPSQDYTATNVRVEGWAIKSNMNMLLNYARRNQYGKQDTGNDDIIRSWLKKHINTIAKRVNATTKSVFKLDEVYAESNKSRGIRAGDVNLNQVNMVGLYSIVAGLFECNVNAVDLTVQCKPRIRATTGELPGWSFMATYVYGFSPFHLKGGLARSNLKFHNFKTYLGKRAVESGFKITGKKLNGKKKHEFNDVELAFFKKVQAEHKNACKQLYLCVKQLINDTLINPQPTVIELHEFFQFEETNTKS